MAELDRYVARVVQYLTYCIAGQESGEMLSIEKGFSISELIDLYVEYINILGLSDENPFINREILLALRKGFLVGGDEVLQYADDLFQMMRKGMRRGMVLYGISIQYDLLPNMQIYVIADVQAGIRLAEYDWYNMSSCLKTRAGFIAIEDVNPSRHLEFS